jgi:hypothetical protein
MLKAPDPQKLAEWPIWAEVTLTLLTVLLALAVVL